MRKSIVAKSNGRLLTPPQSRPAKSAYRKDGVAVFEDTRHPGRYRILWTDGAGVRRERSGGRVLAEAKRRADEIARTADDVDQGSVTVAALVEAYIASQTHVAPTTLAKMRSLLQQHVVTEVGGVVCRQLTARKAGKVMTEMKGRGYARETRLAVAKLLRALGRFGVQHGAWSGQQDPLALVKVGRAKLTDRVASGRVRPEDIPTRDQVRDLCETLEAQGQPMWALVARVIDATGIRWGEAVALTDEHIDLVNRTLYVRQALTKDEHGRLIIDVPKTPASDRDIPLTKDVAERLAEYMDGRVPGLLFVGPNGGLARSGNVHSRVLKPARAACSYPTHCAWHSIRHTTITRWVSKGSIANASKLAGHETPDFTMRRYVGTDSSYADAARDLVE